MARRSGVQDFLTNFNMAYGLSKKVGQDIELSRIANAKPEEMQGFTTDDTAQLEAAAKSGQYDIGTKTKDDGTFEAYTVTPKADPSQTGTVAMRGVTDFMGNRTAGRITPAQEMSARERAMAGVIMKSDPAQGARMLRDVTQGERDDQRWDRQTQQWATDDADREAKRADDKTLKSAFASQSQDQGFDNYLKNVSPVVLKTLVSQGKLDQAKQFQSFVDSNEGKAYAGAWVNGVRRLSVGDSRGALSVFEKMYNDQLFNDGNTVRMSPVDGKPDHFSVEMFGPKGESLGAKTMPMAELAKQAALHLEPTRAIEFMAQQQGKRDAEEAVLTRQLELEGQRQQGREVAEDRRDQRLSLQLGAQQRALDQRLAASEREAQQRRDTVKPDAWSVSMDATGRTITRTNKTTGAVEIINAKTGKVINRLNSSADAANRPAPAPASAVPAAAIEHLRKNPALAAQFEQKYGKGTAAAVLGN